MRDGGPGGPGSGTTGRYTRFSTQRSHTVTSSWVVFLRRVYVKEAGSWNSLHTSHLCKVGTRPDCWCDYTKKQAGKHSDILIWKSLSTSLSFSVCLHPLFKTPFLLFWLYSVLVSNSLNFSQFVLNACLGLHTQQQCVLFFVCACVWMQAS